MNYTILMYSATTSETVLTKQDSALDSSYLSMILREDSFVCHVTGAQKHNVLCFVVDHKMFAEFCI